MTMASPPDISILLPMWNAAATLPACLRSIQRQYARHWQCIMVDDGSQDSSKALAQARRYEPEAKLVLLHVTVPIPSGVTLNLPEELQKSQAEKAQQSLAAFAERNGVADEVDLVVRTGHAGREILSHAEEVNADLIVIASHDPRWGDFLLGSVAAFVVRHAHCSVFVVRERAG